MKRIVTDLLIGLPIVIGLYTLFDYLFCTLFFRVDFAFDVKGCISAG